MRQSSAPVLFLDFDETLIPIHLHNLFNSLRNNLNMTDEDRVTIIKQNIHEEKIRKWKEKIERYYQAGYKFAVISNSAYGRFIRFYLENILRLEKNILQRFSIVARTQDENTSKDQLGKRALILLNESEGNEAAFVDSHFVDDNGSNREAISTSNIGNRNWSSQDPQDFLEDEDNPVSKKPAKLFPLLPQIFGRYPTPVDDPQDPQFQKDSSDIDFAAEPSSLLPWATCLSLPDDEQDFFSAVNFLKQVILTENGEFKPRDSFKDEQEEGMQIGVISIGNGPGTLQSQVLLFAHIVKQKSNNPIIKFSLGDVNLYDTVEKAVQACQKAHTKQVILRGILERAANRFKKFLQEEGLASDFMSIRPPSISFAAKEALQFLQFNPDFSIKNLENIPDSLSRQISQGADGFLRLHFATIDTNRFNQNNEPVKIKLYLCLQKDPNKHFYQASFQHEGSSIQYLRLDEALCAYIPYSQEKQIALMVRDHRLKPTVANLQYWEKLCRKAQLQVFKKKFSVGGKKWTLEGKSYYIPNSAYSLMEVYKDYRHNEISTSKLLEKFEEICNIASNKKITIFRRDATKITYPSILRELSVIRSLEHSDATPTYQ